MMTTHSVVPQQSHQYGRWFTVVAIIVLTLSVPRDAAFATEPELRAVPAVSQVTDTTILVGCASDTLFHPFDFWVGAWTVKDSLGVVVGHDEVTATVGGCAFRERWRGTGGDVGESLFYYAPDQHRWKQVWVTAQPLTLGGTKEKRLVGRVEAGRVRFQGELVGPRAIVLDRTTLMNEPDGRVHQQIEVSRDGGQRWTLAFDGWYSREAPVRREP